MRPSKRRERSLLNSSQNQPLPTRPLQDRLSPQSRPLLERLGPQNRPSQEQLNQPDQPLLERLGPLSPSRPTPRGRDPAPRPSWHKASLRAPPREMNLLERMNVRPLLRSLSPSPPSTAIGRSLKRQLSRGSSPSSSNSPSPSSKRIRLLSSTPKSLSPCATETSLAPLGQVQADRSLTPDVLIAPRSLPTQLTDHKQRIRTTNSTDPGRSGNSPPPIFLGTRPTVALSSPSPLAASRPASAWRSISRTSRAAGTKSKSPPELPVTSLLLNGSEFSEARPSTSTTSSPLSTALQLMKRERLALETQESALASLTRNGVSVPLRTGHQLGGSLRKPSASFSPTVLPNSTRTATISTGNFLPNLPPRTPGSSCSISPRETWSKEDNLASLWTSTLSRISTPPSSCQMVPNLLPNEVQTTGDQTSRPALVAVSPTSATGLILPSDAHHQTPSADTATSASLAKGAATVKTNARSRTYQQTLGSRPKYLRYNLWNTDTSPTPTIAEWSETASPLPRPPLSETLNPIALKTIAENPSLFRIVTPINVDRFEKLLSDHPNLPFVDSVCTGLREGFWPWADTLKDGYPSSFDGARPTPSDSRKAAFIREQRDVEIEKDRFSPAFGHNLLPGMYSMPAHAVPKPNSSDLRMVTDHSAGPFSLNSMIDHDKVTGFPLDNMTHMGEMLLSNFHLTHGVHELLVWKSDIAEAHRLMPLHPLWQLKQVNTVDGWRYVDRNATFGSSSSAAIFISFNSLVAWIAKNKQGIRHLATYADDSSGFDRKDDLLLYEPYATRFPRHQTLLLRLWDELSIPHKPKKQVFGAVIPIIGIDVDPNAMTLTLSRPKNFLGILGTGVEFFERYGLMYKYNKRENTKLERLKLVTKKV
jgi:hypothetical protein